MTHTPKKQTSGTIAKDRLKLLLVSERVDCSPEVMEMLKNDIIQVISKYMLIDTEGFDIRITKNETDCIYHPQLDVCCTGKFGQ